jgi:hypothetical protein
LGFRRSNKQCEQSNHAHADNQHCKCYGIVVQPIQLLLHDTPPLRSETATKTMPSGRLAFPCPERKCAESQRAARVGALRMTRFRNSGTLRPRKKISGCMPLRPRGPASVFWSARDGRASKRELYHTKTKLPPSCSITASARASRFQRFRHRATCAQTNSRAQSIVLNQFDDLWSPSAFRRARDRRPSCRILACHWWSMPEKEHHSHIINSL